MESLEYRYQDTVNAMATLKEVMEYIENPALESMYKILRDSCIQRFEYSIDIFCKLLRLYMQDKRKVVFEIITPRSTIKAAFDEALIEKAEYTILLECVADRNLTSHTYREVLAQRIVERIPVYYDTMYKILINKITLEEKKSISSVQKQLET